MTYTRLITILPSFLFWSKSLLRLGPSDRCLATNQLPLFLVNVHHCQVSSHYSTIQRKKALPEHNESETTELRLGETGTTTFSCLSFSLVLALNKS